MDKLQINIIAKMVETIYIPHRYAEPAIEGILDCIARSAYGVESECACLLAPSGCGKTATCTSLVNQLGRRIDVVDGVAINAPRGAYMELPDSISLSAFGSEILEAIDSPGAQFGRPRSIGKRLVLQINGSKMQVVFIDEVNRLNDLLHSRSETVQRAAKAIFSAIRRLVNSCPRTVFVLVGTAEFLPLIRADPQLKRRFRHCFTLRNMPFHERTGKDKFPYTTFLRNLAAAIPDVCGLESFPTFEGDVEQRAAFAQTQGAPSWTAYLCSEAIRVALEDDRKIVTLDDFAVASRRECVRGNLCVEDIYPFEMTREELINITRADGVLA